MLPLDFFASCCILFWAARVSLSLWSWCGCGNIWELSHYLSHCFRIPGSIGQLSHLSTVLSDRHVSHFGTPKSQDNVTKLTRGAVKLCQAASFRVVFVDSGYKNIFSAWILIVGTSPLHSRNSTSSWYHPTKLIGRDQHFFLYNMKRSIPCSRNTLL